MKRNVLFKTAHSARKPVSSACIEPEQGWKPWDRRCARCMKAALGAQHLVPQVPRQSHTTQRQQNRLQRQQPVERRKSEKLGKTCWASEGLQQPLRIPQSSLGHLHLLRDPSLECLPASLPLHAPAGHSVVVFISTTSHTSSYHHITPLTIKNLYIIELIRCPKPSFPSSPAILLPDTTSSNCFCQASLGIYTSRRRNTPKTVFYWFESLK